MLDILLAFSQECSGDIASTKKFLASLREKICSIPVHEDSEILDEDEEVKMKIKIVKFFIKIP